jgi:hypothetical protein
MKQSLLSYLTTKGYDRTRRYLSAWLQLAFLATMLGHPAPKCPAPVVASSHHLHVLRISCPGVVGNWRCEYHLDARDDGVVDGTIWLAACRGFDESTDVGLEVSEGRSRNGCWVREVTEISAIGRTVE